MQRIPPRYPAAVRKEQRITRPPLTLATILYSGAVPPPTAQVRPRLLDLLARVTSSASTAFERTGSKKLVTPPPCSSPFRYTTTVYALNAPVSASVVDLS